LSARGFDPNQGKVHLSLSIVLKNGAFLEISVEAIKSKADAAIGNRGIAVDPADADFGSNLATLWAGAGRTHN